MTDNIIITNNNITIFRILFLLNELPPVGG